MSRLLGNAMSALVFALAELHKPGVAATVLQQHPVVVCVLQLAVDK